jgi:hypothetical protein
MLAPYDATSETPAMRDPLDFDSPWKEMLEQSFQDFLAFFFPGRPRGD